MKPNVKYFTLVVLLLVMLAFPGSALAASPQAAPHDDKIVFAGTYTLASGESLDGNLAVFAGTASTEKNSQVNGDIVLVGGTLTVNGVVNGNVNTVGGSLFLGDTAIIHGDVSTIGAAMHRSAKAQVDGKVVTGGETPFQFNMPTVVTPSRPVISNVFKPFTDALWLFLRALAMAALAIILSLFVGDHESRIAHAVVVEPVTAGGLGLLTAIIAPIILVILTITILLIPVTLLGILVLAFAGIFGWIALGLETGNRIAHLFKSEWALPVAAGVGTFILTLVAFGVGFIPCVGWLVPALISIIGLGGVIMSRFGSMPYPQAPAPMPAYHPITPVRPIPPVSNPAPTMTPPTITPPEPPSAPSENDRPEDQK